MNTRQAIQPLPTSNVLSLSFSASRSRFIAGLGDGLRVFRTDNCLTTSEPELPYGCGASIAETLDDRYIAYVYNRRVAKGGPSVVIFWDSLLGLELSRFDFHEPVLGLRLSRKWMAVILEERTVLFQYQDIDRQSIKPAGRDDRGSDADDKLDQHKHEVLRAPNLVHSLYPTAPNPFALATLSDNLLLLPAQATGQIQLITMKSSGSSTKRVVRAHNSSIRCLALSQDASLFATASEQGTLFRVFSTKTLDQVAEHRRGMDHAVIYSLAFSPGNRWVASTSDKGTLHVFDLQPQDSAEVATLAREREGKERSHRKSQSYAGHRVSGGMAFDKESLSGLSAGRSSPSPSTAIPGGAGTAYQGSVQEYYGLRPPPASASPPAGGAAVSAMAAFKASPLAPRIFKDSRSVASAPIYLGTDPPHWQGGPAHVWTTTPNGTRKRINNPVLPLPNDPSGRPPKGIIAFEPKALSRGDENGAVMYVVGGGSDARWEKFELLPATTTDGSATGGWALVKRGFRKYLTRQFAD